MLSKRANTHLSVSFGKGLEKKVFLNWLAFFLFFCAALGAKPLSVRLASKSAILMNADTGAVLYEKRGHEQKYPASITKIATLLYALSQNGEKIDEIVSCPNHCLKRIQSSLKIAHNYRDPSYWLEPDGTHFWLKRGEKMPFLELLYGLMLSSGNDAANYIAHHVGGTIPKFMWELNAYVRSLGCENTHFCNPHGLHHPKHVTTAYDMALITREALKNSTICQIASAKEHIRPETNRQQARTFKQRNRLLQPGKFFYPKALGMKAGYHSQAHYTFVAVAKDKERTLIASLLDCQDVNALYRDAIRLFETAFAEEKEERLLFNKDENLFTREIKKGKTPLKASLLEDVTISYYLAEEPHVQIELNWEALELPIRAGEWVGEIHILNEMGHILERVPLCASQDVDKKGLFVLIDTFKRGFLALTPFRCGLMVFFLICLSLVVYFVLRLRKSSQT